jgi:hypothetical protein
MIVLGLCAILVPSILYDADKGPENAECFQVTNPFYSKFRCTGSFDNVQQSFYCGDSSFFSNYPAQNEYGQSCGNRIPACIACNISDGVIVSHGYQCHAIIPGCAPMFTELRSSIQAFRDLSNLSQCRTINNDLYAQCTTSINNDRHVFFPVPIVFGSIIAIIGVIFLICEYCCEIGHAHDDSYSHTWLCCVKYCSNYNICNYYTRWMFRHLTNCTKIVSGKNLCAPMITCFGAYIRICCCCYKKQEKSEDNISLKTVIGGPGGL